MVAGVRAGAAFPRHGIGSWAASTARGRAPLATATTLRGPGKAFVRQGAEGRAVRLRLTDWARTDGVRWTYALAGSPRW